MPLSNGSNYVACSVAYIHLHTRPVLTIYTCICILTTQDSYSQAMEIGQLGHIHKNPKVSMKPYCQGTLRCIKLLSYYSNFISNL